MKSYQIKPSFRIGKSGIKETLIKEIITQLKKKSIVKIKILSSFFDSLNISVEPRQYKKEVALLLSKKTNSEIVKIIGNSIIIKRKTHSNPYDSAKKGQ